MSSMRGLNYLSANARALCEDAEARKADAVFDLSNKYEDFDIGELLQSVADLLCGQAAQAGVDFVLFHGDVGIKHVSVRGNAEGLAYALGHVSWNLSFSRDRS
jgi:osomolarity two-component system response regulator SSK1